MKDLTVLFQELAVALFVPLGFRQKETLFYRTINDVFQYVNLQCYRDNVTFSVTFDVHPFCCDFGYDSIYPWMQGLWHLEWFAPLPDLRNKCNQDTNFFAEQLKNMFSEFIIPVFIKAVDTESTLKEFDAMEKRCLTKEEFHLATVLGKVDMHIKLGNYMQAIRALQWLDGHTNSIEFAEEILKLIQRLKNEDTDYISHHIKTKERTSRIALGLERQ